MVSSVDELVLDCDHVVLAAPRTERTERMIDAAVIARMKRGVHVVNVARGALIDMIALRAALDTGQIARARRHRSGAASARTLVAHAPSGPSDPHMSWMSGDGIRPVVDGFLDNLARSQSGPLLHEVKWG
ncbi:MAG: hypothetical protein GEU71_15710 [Actinobacteria bacterium]|nr:hypothetical protein [Actinomycetota bacterium]